VNAEVIHTSVQRGLDGGTGFAVAARTGGMPRALVENISALSGLHDSWSGASDWDRTLRATRCIKWSGDLHWVGSVIRPCGVDHTGRGNRIAHHRLLDASEVAVSDPAQILCDHEQWMAAWQGEPRELDAPAALRTATLATTAALTWQKLFGDAGVAAEMLERAFQSGVGAWIVLPAGSDRLQLLQELVAVLPQGNRWKRGWSTRPLRPTSETVSVICLVDEREPEVMQAPVHAAWMLRPIAGSAPKASESMLARARQGGPSAVQSKPISAAVVNVQWTPPQRLTAPVDAVVAPITPTHPDLEMQPQEIRKPIYIQMDAPPRASKGLWILAAFVCAALAAAAWWWFRGGVA